MLEPGEFIVNRQAAQANLPMLSAINSGATPAMVGGVVHASLASSPRPASRPVSVSDYQWNGNLSGYMDVTQNGGQVQKFHFGGPVLQAARNEGEESVDYSSIQDEWKEKTRELNLIKEAIDAGQIRARQITLPEGRGQQVRIEINSLDRWMTAMFPDEPETKPVSPSKPMPVYSGDTDEISFDELIPEVNSSPVAPSGKRPSASDPFKDNTALTYDEFMLFSDNGREIRKWAKAVEQELIKGRRADDERNPNEEMLANLSGDINAKFGSARKLAKDANNGEGDRGAFDAKVQETAGLFTSVISSLTEGSTKRFISRTPVPSIVTKMYQTLLNPKMGAIDEWYKKLRGKTSGTEGKKIFDKFEDEIRDELREELESKIRD